MLERVLPRPEHAKRHVKSGRLAKAGGCAILRYRQVSIRITKVLDGGIPNGLDSHVEHTTQTTYKLSAR